MPKLPLPRTASRPAQGLVALSRGWWRLEQSRGFLDARVKWIRDRGLDHAVEKEKHLIPFHSLKDLLLSSPSSSLLLSSPSSSLPLSFIAERRVDLRLPFRAIRFIRLFPSAFLEELPTSSPTHPVIRPAPELVRVHEDEQCAVTSCRAETADRLLRLLMLCPARRLPLSVVERLRWDLGLPRDFARSLLPSYPDYFQLSPSADGSPALDLELVCYNKPLAVSAMESYAAKTGGYKKGQPLAFLLHFSRGFDLEKKVRKWLDEWQKLPYISPYEDASHLPPKSDLAEKWTVGVLHEVLNLLVPKKTEKENLLLLGKHLGLPASFKKVIAHHPGIFYISNKLRTQTVVLREAYSRDLLVEKHPLMGLRYQYIHLMHKGKESGGWSKDHKPKWRVASSTLDNDNDVDKEEEDNEEAEEEEEGEEEEEDGEDFLGASDMESDDNESDDDDDVSENATRRISLPHLGEIAQSNGDRKPMLRRAVLASPIEGHLETRKANQTFSRTTELHREHNAGTRLRGRADYQSAEKRLSAKRSIT